MSMRNWTDDQLILAYKTSNSYSDICRLLDIKVHGGNFRTIQRHMIRLKLDKDKLQGQKWAASKTLNRDYRIPLKELLVNGRHFQGSKLKKRLIKEKGWKDECAKCGVGNLWQDEPLVLELHHVSGDHLDNRISNLVIYCPNCHSQAHRNSTL